MSESPATTSTINLPRVVVALILLPFAALGGWYVYRIYFVKPPPVVIPTLRALEPRQPVEVPSVMFTDITASAGITFHFHNGAVGDRLLPETMGGGVAVLDYDRDGRQDLLFVNGRPWPGNDKGPPPTTALYRNLGENRFGDVTTEVGLNIPLYGMGVCVGDVDNDGWPDVFIAGIGGNKLFRNEGGRRFQDVTAQAHVGGPDPWPSSTYEDFKRRETPLGFPSSCTFVDYDGDSRLDLLVCHYITWSPALDLAIDAKVGGLTRAYGQPIWFEGAQSTLYRNVDGTRFEDVSQQVGLHVREQFGTGAKAKLRAVGKALAVVTADVNDDGWPDLLFACDTTRNFLFLNVPDGPGGRKFEEVSQQANFAYAEHQARGGMGLDWACYHVNKFGLVIANFAKEPATFFCREPGARLRFSDHSLAEGLYGPSRPPVKFGAFFFDYDLDGRLDLLFCNGHLEPEINRVEGLQTYAQPASLFWNTGTSPGAFEMVSERAAGTDLFKPIVGRGSAYADLDNDGDLDVVLVNNRGTPLVLRNDQQLGHHWIRLVLEGDGRTVNRNAIGAQLFLETQGQPLHRQVISGRGYLSQSELPLTIGLGKADKLEHVLIKWPGRHQKTQELKDLPAGQTITIKMMVD
jgi:hypothetical protein